MQERAVFHGLKIFVLMNFSNCFTNSLYCLRYQRNVHNFILGEQKDDYAKLQSFDQQVTFLSCATLQSNSAFCIRWSDFCSMNLSSLLVCYLTAVKCRAACAILHFFTSLFLPKTTLLLHEHLPAVWGVLTDSVESKLLELSPVTYLLRFWLRCHFLIQSWAFV